MQELSDTCLDKWRTQARVAKFLQVLIHKEAENPLLRSFQQHIRAEVEELNFSELLCRLPSAACIESSATSLDLQKQVGDLADTVEVLFPDVEIKRRYSKSLVLNN